MKNSKFIIILLLILFLIIVINKNSKFGALGGGGTNFSLTFNYPNPAKFGEGDAKWNGIVLYLEKLTTQPDSYIDEQPANLFGPNNIFYTKVYKTALDAYYSNSRKIQMQNIRANSIKTLTKNNQYYELIKDYNVNDPNTVGFSTATLNAFTTKLRSNNIFFSDVYGTVASISPPGSDAATLEQIGSGIAYPVLFSSIFKNSNYGLYREYDSTYANMIPFVQTEVVIPAGYITVQQSTIKPATLPTSSTIRTAGSRVYLRTVFFSILDFIPDNGDYKFGIAFINNRSTIQTPDYLKFPFTVGDFKSVKITKTATNIYASGGVSGLSVTIEYS